MFTTTSCAICGYTITDPVCKGCYLKQALMILNDLHVPSTARRLLLNKIKNRLPIETINDTECILCKKDNVAFCGHCFSVILARVLREQNYENISLERDYLYA